MDYIESVPLSNYQLALRAWMALAPAYEGGSCCYEDHYTTDIMAVPLPDHEVCKRERAWRKYVKEREMATSLGVIF